MTKYDVLIVDAPWKYNNKKTGGSHKSGASQKYDTMTTDDLSDLRFYINDLMQENSYLFLWTTNSMMKEALYLVECYGFEFKTILTWDKMRYGMGYWFRGQTEHCLFGVKGKVPALKTNFRNLIQEKPNGHSKKPDVFYGMIQTVFNGKNILELFATRERFANWTCIGNEISGHDIETDLRELVRQENPAMKLQQYMREKGEL